MSPADHALLTWTRRSHAGHDESPARAPAPVAALLAAPVLLAACILGWLWFSYGYVEDDAFIHLEFARSVASGQGFAFNGSVTNGDTAPLWVLLLATIHALGIGWVTSAKLACVAGLGLALSGVWRLASDLPHEASGQVFLPLAAVAVTVLNPFFAHWSFSGMEATAALGWSLWAIWAVFLGAPTRLRCILAAVLLALGPLLRPELLLFDALAAPALLWRCWRALGSRSSAHRVACVAALGILMLLPVAVWCGYALHSFGSIVPNTNLAKRGAVLRELVPRLASVYLTGFPVTLLLLPVALLRAVRRGPTPAAIWVLLAWPLACMAFYLADHTLVQTRYCLLSMPGMSIAVLWLSGNTARPRQLLGATAAMLLASTFVIGSIVVPHVANKQGQRRAFAAVSAYVRDELPARAPVAVFAIGQIGFESRHPLIDLGGITQPDVVPYLGNPAATLRWAKARGARYFIGDGPPEPGAMLVFGIPVPYIGWTLRHSLYHTTQPYGVYQLR